MAKTRRIFRVFMRLDFGGYNIIDDVCHFLNACNIVSDFLLKPELLRAISDLGFEHPSEGRVHPQALYCFFLLTISPFIVQQECIPQAVLGMDVLCQAKSGHGKTAVFVLATLQQLEPVHGDVSVLVLCHTRELAFQIKNEYTRFAKYMPDVRVGTFYGGTPVTKDAEILRDKNKCPHIVVATPGRLNALARDKVLDAKNVKHFVLDECDKMLEQLGQSNSWRSTSSNILLIRHDFATFSSRTTCMLFDTSFLGSCSTGNFRGRMRVAGHKRSIPADSSSGLCSTNCPEVFYVFLHLAPLFFLFCCRVLLSTSLMPTSSNRHAP